MLPIAIEPNTPAIMDAATLAELQKNFDTDFSELGGGGVHRIKVNKADFSLISGRTEEHIPMNELFVVMVASNPRSHCTWYTRAYVPGQEPAAPDLCWWSGDPYPDDLPTQYRSKISIGGVERWGYQTQRRVAWAVLRRNAVSGQMELDDEHVYIMDITSANLFGTGNAQMGMYKWSELAGLCRTWSRSGSIISPSMFVTQIVLDTSSPLPGIVLFHPIMNNSTNMPQILPANIIQTVMKLRNDPATLKALEINEKRTLAGSAPASAPVAPEPKPAPAPVVSEPVQPAQAAQTAQSSVFGGADVDALLAEAEATLNGTPKTEATPTQINTMPVEEQLQAFSDMEDLIKNL